MDNRADVIEERSFTMRVWRKRDCERRAIEAALFANGENLKESAKSATVRVGGLVVKSSCGSFVMQLARHTAQRERYRQGWRAALYLEQHGIPSPRPVAHVEWGIAGFIWKHATVTEFLQDCVDVEHFADGMIAGGATSGEIAAYLARLARSVNALTESGAVHTDLAGKNILTRDGDVFYFIDMDGILLGSAYLEGLRLRNHVQLYDSFIDRCAHEMLVPFVEAMLPGGTPVEGWIERVRSEQARRRAITVTAWKREGRLT